MDIRECCSKILKMKTNTRIGYNTCKEQREMEVKKSNRKKWKEEMMDDIKKNGLYSLIFRGSSVLMVIMIMMLVKMRKTKNHTLL